MDKKECYKLLYSINQLMKSFNHYTIEGNNAYYKDDEILVMLTLGQLSPLDGLYEVISRPSKLPEEHPFYEEEGQDLFNAIGKLPAKEKLIRIGKNGEVFNGNDEIIYEKLFPLEEQTHVLPPIEGNNLYKGNFVIDDNGTCIPATVTNLLEVISNNHTGHNIIYLEFPRNNIIRIHHSKADINTTNPFIILDKNYFKPIKSYCKKGCSEFLNFQFDDSFNHAMIQYGVTHDAKDINVVNMTMYVNGVFKLS